MSDSAFAASTARARSSAQRRLPIGAEYLGGGATSCRVWAPRARRVEVVHGRGTAALTGEADGYFSGTVALEPGDRYQFRLDSSDLLLPDPASRFQPEGPHGPSEVIDPHAFTWSDTAWRGARLPGQVFYEIHIGAFTREGTWAAAERQLSELVRLGVTLVEIMPIAEFAGGFGWGYDGVDLYAPYHEYGRPDDLRAFVNRAHVCGLAVILDVVYNHFGPDGNYLREFSPSYFSEHYDNEWGDAINFDHDDAGPVREYFITNAGYWIDEFHFDGLRLDATQQIHDKSSEHVVRAIAARARDAAGAKPIVVVAENEPQHAHLARPVEEGGFGLDALWNDDFHHGAMVALTGKAEAYYRDTHGEPQEFVSAAKYGTLFQGQYYHWQRDRRGTPTWGLPPDAFITFLQNHDQVANSARGLRSHLVSNPGRWRAMTALLLLGPWTPMLFMGQEFASSAPFLYFADFAGDLGAAIRHGRAEFMRQFPSVAELDERSQLAPPGDRETFEQCVLDFRERESHREAYAMHLDLLRLRREEPAFNRQAHHGTDGSVLSSSAFMLRFFTPGHADDHLMIVNLGATLERDSIADPLLAPPLGTDWRVRWSSEDLRYGGGGTPEPFPDGRWRIAPESALVLAPGPQRKRPPLPRLRRHG